MGFELDIFKDERLEADYIEWLVDEHSIDIGSTSRDLNFKYDILRRVIFFLSVNC